MLRALLADRFKLVVHTDTRPVPGFLLTVGKGKAKLKEADGSGETGCPAQRAKRRRRRTVLAATCRNMTMEAFAETLRGLDSSLPQRPGRGPERPRGAWDFDLTWTDKRTLSYAGADGITLFAAIDRQLG